jgi:hypothetical protein
MVERLARPIPEMEEGEVMVTDYPQSEAENAVISAEPPQPEASKNTETVEQLQTEETPAMPYEQPTQDQEEGLTMFYGTVELALAPPLGLEQMLHIHKQLKEMPSINVMNLGGSVDKGITIRAHLPEAIPLLKILNELPDVLEAEEELPGSESEVPGRRDGEQTPLRRIIVRTRLH